MPAASDIESWRFHPSPLVLISETEHVLLGWRYLRWALASGDRGLRDAVGVVFRQAERHVGLGAVTELEGAVSDMKAHGYLPVGERRDVALGAVREVVMPAARALLGDFDEHVANACTNAA